MKGFNAVWIGALLTAGASIPAPAQTPAAPVLIYTCVTESGQKLTRDRFIQECKDRPQRVLNSDGSVKQIIGPTLSTEELAEAEARDAKRILKDKQEREAILRDRNLRARFPNEAAHNRAREEALETYRKAIRISEERLARLAKERKPLMDEAEFYPGKSLPVNLKTQIDANDASVDAQRTLLQNQKLEVVRISAVYDAELERLKRLWAGAQPGSMGALPTAASAPPASAKK